MNFILEFDMAEDNMNCGTRVKNLSNIANLYNVRRF